MKRLLSLVLLSVLALGLASPAGALTQEEILKRRLDKMRQADPQLRTEDQQRQEQFKESTSNPGVAPSKANTETLAIPDPVRAPSPDPRGAIWQQQPGKAGTPAATAKTSPPAPVPQPVPQPVTPPAQQAPRPAVASQPAVAPMPAPVPQPAAAPQPMARDSKTAAALAAQAAKAAANGDNQTALTMLGEALAADPADPDLLNNRGNVLGNMGRSREALADYDRAIAMKSSDSAYFTNRGLAHERLGNQERACADYKKACDLGDCEFYKSFKTEGHCR